MALGKNTENKHEDGEPAAPAFVTHQISWDGIWIDPRKGWVYQCQILVISISLIMRVTQVTNAAVIGLKNGY
tara:strand:- start:359 stop:574 length:216 start_codon:yes stop_codon:yes gene_type:complete